MKDHEIAELINQVRDVAKEFGQTQQLRERLASILVPVLKQSEAIIDICKVDDMGCIKPRFHLREDHPTSGYLKYFQGYIGKTVKVSIEFINYEDEIMMIEE